MTNQELNNDGINTETKNLPIQNQSSGIKKEGRIRRTIFRKIINTVISIFLFLIIVLLIGFGFTQTKTFREFLRKELISIANKETNGVINIEKLDGTIFTSLFIRNVSITIESDTLLFAKNIELKTSPVQLLLKKIFIRKFLIEDAKIQMLQDSSGKWNIEKFLKPTPEDTSKSSFSYIIHAPDIQLKNISITKQNKTNIHSKQNYTNVNWDDIQINHLNFTAEAIADIENSNYLLILKELSFKPNLTRFNLRYISGEFAITKNFASVNKFYLLTDSSEIKINVRVDSLNLFAGTDLKDFKNYPVTIEAKASPFNFDDLSSFINATEILKGSPSFELQARGKFGGFKIEKAKLDYRNTHLNFSGQVLNLNTPSKLYLQAKLTNTDFDYKDINALLPWLNLPSYAQLVLTNVNINYEGEPTNFKTKFAANVGNGSIEGEGKMNVNLDPITYNVRLSCNDLNLEALTGFPTKLNAKGSIAGKGTNPANIFADIKLNVTNSLLNNISIDKFNVTAIAKDRKFELEIDGEAEGAKSIVMGNVIYDKDTIPTYSIIGDIKKLDASRFLHDSKYESDLNMYFNLEGKSINPDEMNATFSFGVDSSYFQKKWINASLVEAKIKKDSTSREIFLTSDFIDFKITGNYSLNKAIQLVSYESKTITEIISKKLSELNPLSIVDKPVINDTVSTNIPIVASEDIKFNYDFKFKDFKLVALLMGNDQLDISGSGYGSVSNKNNNFSVNAQLNLDYIIMMQKGTTIYLSDFKGDFNFTRDNQSHSFDKLFGTASITGKRFYSGSNIKSLNADITFNQSKLFFNIAANYDDMIKAEGDGVILMTPLEQKFLISSLDINYDDIEWKNKDTIKASFNSDHFKITNCVMAKDSTLISASGIVESSGNQNIILKAEKISGEIIERYLVGIKNSRLKAKGSVDARIEGQFSSPLITVDYSVKDLDLEGNKLGNIEGYLKYSDKKMITNFSFLDAAGNKQKPLFLFNATFPIDLRFETVTERFIKEEPISIRVTSQDFNLSQLGGIIPGIKNQHGNLKSDLSITGSIDNPNYFGYITLSNGFFRSTHNNLDYSCGMKLNFKEKGFSIDSLVLTNEGGSDYPGKLKGSGSISFDGFTMKDVNLKFNGDIAILGKNTQAVSPFFYGDLNLQSDGDWLLTKKGNKFFFKGNMIMKKTNLFYTVGREEGLSSNNRVNLVYLVDSSKIDKEQIRFKKILEREKILQEKIVNKVESNFNLDYEIGITSGKDTRATFILAQALNQKLIVEMKGSMKYESVNNVPHAQGMFELLQGSQLKFYKDFDAIGTLRFEDDITNPYLDISSSFRSDYYDANGKSEPVEIRMKIQGQVSELGKNLATDQTALRVYVGAQNIKDNVYDQTHDYADALSFIIFGKFKNDLTAQDKTAVAGQTALSGVATALASSGLTGLMRSAFGADYVNNISIFSTGQETKFSLGGRIENFTYAIGGSTETFNNIGTANFMLQYRFFPTNLNVRIERRDPLTKSYSLDEKVFELGLKYKFEF